MVEFLSLEEELPPTSVEELNIARFLRRIQREGSPRHIHNAFAELQVLKVADRVLPVVCCTDPAHSSYVCSFFSHYVSYAKVEIQLTTPPWARFPLYAILVLLGGWIRFTRIDRCIFVNNFLLSTNLYPDLTSEELGAILTEIRARDPDHAVVFRSVHAHPCGNGLFAKLAGLQLKPIASRRFYIQDPSTRAVETAKPNKQDHSLHKRSGYTLSPLTAPTDSELERVVALYDLLYLDKYSSLNPQLTPAFVRAAIEEGFLSVHILKKDDRIDGVVGYYTRAGVMTTPLFGYDTSLPSELGLYRLLSHALIEHAKVRGVILNASSGAGHFKRVRGGVAESEYSMVADAHLSWRRRLGWTGLRWFANGVALPIMRWMRV